jgi:ribosomal protein S18 acetylase RimI-like enzyme
MKANSTDTGTPISDHRLMHSQVSIRIGTTADIPAIAAVVNSAFEIETFFDGERTDEKNIAEMMLKGKFLLMEDASGHLLASVYVEVRGELIAHDQLIVGDQRAYFGMFAVEPSHQSMGLGRLMVGAAEKHCRSNGYKFIDFKVLSLRTKLLPFYHQLGYMETGIEEFHSSRHLKAGTQCHFILMSKLL